MRATRARQYAKIHRPEHKTPMHTHTLKLVPLAHRPLGNLHNAHHHAPTAEHARPNIMCVQGPVSRRQHAATENEMHNNSPVRIVRIDQFTCVCVRARVYVFSGRNRLHNTHSLWPYVFMCVRSVFT